MSISKGKEIRMSKIGKELIAGLGQAIEYARGNTKVARRVYVAKVADKIDVAEIRNSLRLSQMDFAARYGFSHGNIRNWEQGHRDPDPAARAYLTVIHFDHKVVEKALAAANQGVVVTTRVTPKELSRMQGFKMVSGGTLVRGKRPADKMKKAHSRVAAG
jgi:putative transcriptional regulator